MDTFERVRKWLAAKLELSEEVITPQSTLGDLSRYHPRSTAPEDQGTSSPSLLGNVSPDSLDLIELALAFEEEFEVEVLDGETETLNGLLLDENTTVRQIADLVDRGMQG
jgi:acyl carrier protein